MLRTIFLIYSCFLLINGEIFTALDHLERALHAEQQVATELRRFVETEKQKLAILDRIADEYSNHSRTALQNPPKYLSNPIASYLLIKRLTADWNANVQPLLTGPFSDSKVVLQSIEDARVAFPKEDDLKGSAEALLRLQDTYNLDSTELANGHLPGVAAELTMTAEDCLELARVAYLAEDYYHTVIWAQEALNRYEREQASAASKATILDYLSYSLYKQGNLKTAFKYSEELLNLDPSNDRVRQNMRYFEQQLLQEAQRSGLTVDEFKNTFEPVRNIPATDSYKQGHEFINYNRLCRGEETHVNPYVHQLTCRYVHNWDPRLILNPIKEETLYFAPWVVIYHNILSDYEIDIVKRLASPRLDRSTARNSQTNRFEPVTYRISKSGWLHDHEHPVIKRISQRVNALLRLSLETVEELQVVNYGIGGHYEPHYDHAESHDDTFDAWRGNRIATSLFYLSDVEAGGGTVFVNLGVKGWPKKGSMLFWFNLLKNGDGDSLTRHAACPVLVGTKWVANKWFHIKGNEFLQPCGLNAYERIGAADFPQSRAEIAKLRKPLI